MKDKRPTLHAVPPMREKSYAEKLSERMNVDTASGVESELDFYMQVADKRKKARDTVPTEVSAKDIIANANRALNLLANGIPEAAETIVGIANGSVLDMGGNRFKAAVFILDRFSVSPKDLMKDVGDVPWSTNLVKGISRANLQKVVTELESDAG